jgi:hypothetical protein
MELREVILVLTLFLLLNVTSFFQNGGYSNSIAMSLFNMILVCFMLIWGIWRIVEQLRTGKGNKKEKETQKKINDFFK